MNELHAYFYSFFVDFILHLVKFIVMKGLLLFVFLLAAFVNGQAQQKLSFEYEGDDLYQFIGKEINSPYAGALIAHFNLKPDAQRTYWGNYNQGISMTVEQGKVALLTLVVLGDESNQTFSGMLPEGLLPDMSIKEAKKQMGDGAEVREKEITLKKGDVLLHVYFSKGKKMESIVLEHK